MHKRLRCELFTTQEAESKDKADRRGIEELKLRAESLRYMPIYTSVTRDGNIAKSYRKVSQRDAQSHTSRVMVSRVELEQGSSVEWEEYKYNRDDKMKR